MKWCDIDWEQRSIHICRNAVKVTDEEIFVKEPKTHAGNRYVYFSAEMESLLREYRQECAYITESYDQRELTDDDFLFRRQGAQLPMTPTTFTYRYAGRKCEKKIADEETAQKIIAALEGVNIKYETYFKLIIATGMRRGEMV